MGNATLTFDDLPSTHTLADISHNSHLDFSSFSYFNSSSASISGLVSPSDGDCAYSAPHALLAWRKTNWSFWPRVVLNATSAAAQGLGPYFDLFGLAMKPMNFTPKYTTIHIEAYGIDFNTSDGVPEIKTHYGMFSMQLRDGAVRQHPSDFASFWPGWGKDVNMVEMWAETEQGEDWPFCIDDLHVKFKAASESTEEEPDTPRYWDGIEDGNMVMQAWRTV